MLHMYHMNKQLPRRVLGTDEVSLGILLHLLIKVKARHSHYNCRK